MALILLVASVSFFVSLMIGYQSIKPKSFFYILDNPNHRSLHKVATPRGGGLALVVAILTAWNLLALFEPVVENFLWLNIAVLLLMILGFLDDLFNIKPYIRFAIQLVVASSCFFFGWDLVTIKLPEVDILLPSILAMIFTIFFILWMLNLYNFMDGMDGFAGGMTLIGFLTFSILGFMHGSTVFAVMSLVVCASAAGFLWFNFPPAKLFMGDAGSTTLGFIVAVFSLWADNRNIFPLWISILIFSPFIGDATVTLVKRLYKKEKIWDAHRSHYYQLLVQSGWSHRKTVVFEYYLMVLSSGFAITAVLASSVIQWVLLLSITVIYLFLIVLFHTAVSHKKK